VVRCTAFEFRSNMILQRRIEMLKKGKKITCVFAGVMLAFFGIGIFHALAADIPITPNKPVKEYYFRFVTHGGDDPYWAVLHQGMLDACKELGCKADMDFCGDDLALQQKRFREAIAMGCDGIALVLNDDKIWDKQVADAMARGIPVISIDNDDTEGARGNQRLCFIVQNEREAGRKIARRVFEKGREMGVNFKKAHVAMSVEMPGAMYGVVRSNGVKDVMKEFGITSFDIIDAGGLESATVQSRQTSYLLAHPETTFFIGLGGITTDRAMASLKAAGYKAGEIVAGGFDPTPGTIEGLKSGYVEATIDAQQYLQGYYPVVVLYLVKRYGFSPNDIDTGGFLVDKNNIGTIERLSPMHIR
jgi:ABC-type sugar transport system substrate-binding protein